MAITESYGYAGTVNAPQWARLVPYAGGMDYGVLSDADWRPTSGGPGDRAVTMAPGIGWGRGVLDVNGAPVTVNHPSASGVRWDLVCARRVWGTKVTSFEIVPGGSSPSIPVREVTPGVEDEQPIALVQITNSAVTQVLDLRCVPGNSGLLAFHEFALQYLIRQATQVVIGNVRHTRKVDNFGVAYWEASTDHVEQKILGSAINGIQVAGNGSRGPLIVKTGQNTDFGNIAFGNQYVAQVGFTTPFPNELLSVQITPIHTDNATIAPFALDIANKNGFRVFYPGVTTPVKRSYLWTAFGY